MCIGINIERHAPHPPTSRFGCLKPELLSDDFQFIFPVVGPLLKDKFIEAFSSFKVREAFPDGKGNYFNFCVDPLEVSLLC